MHLEHAVKSELCLRALVEGGPPEKTLPGRTPLYCTLAQ